MQPTAIKIDHRFGAPHAPATPWESVTEVLFATEIYALTTLLPDGTPHTVPVSGLFDTYGFLFCTGSSEQKTVNIGHNPRGSVHVGSPLFFEGVDIVLRGVIHRVTDADTLTNMASRFVEKYGEFWRFGVGDDALVNQSGLPAWVFRLVPEVAFSFTRGDQTAQTKYEF